MFEVSTITSVFRHRSPLIFQHPHVRAARGDHRFDGQDHPLLQARAAPGIAVIRNLGILVHLGADSVADELANHRKSVALDPALASRSAQLIREMGFEGIAMVEYKQARDGALILMEINGRPWGSIGLPIACGIDYPRHLIQWCLDGTLPPEKSSYREKVMCRRVIGELTHLSNLRAGRPQNWPGAYPSFWASLAIMAVPWLPGMCYDDVWFSDLRPGIAGIRRWFQTRLQRNKT